MNKYRMLLILAVLLAGTALPAQVDCPHYQELMQNAQDYWKANAFESAFNQLTAAREHCPARAAEVDAQFVAFTNEIAKKYTDAERQRAAAERATREARAATARADATATASQQAALRAYANDLAYKSQIALKEGDRIAAFRLAEFAHRYVDDDNPQVTRALLAALYYNDDPDHPPLPWASNLNGHDNAVRSVAFSPDGTQLATGSNDNTAKIWDLNTGKETSTLNGHTNYVLSVAFSPDGTQLATGSYDNTAKIWDLNTRKETITLNGHDYAVRSVAFSPDGTQLATGSDDKTAKIWDLNTRKETSILNGHDNAVRSVAFSPDGTQLATGSLDNTAKIWDLNTRKETSTLNGHDSYVLSVAFSPDGTQLATGSLDNTAKIWDLNTGKETSTLNGHDSDVLSVAFSPDGSKLATGSYDYTAKIWDLNTRKETITLNGHDNAVRSVAFSPDGTQLATGSDDNTAKIWDLNTRKETSTLNGHDSYVWSVAFSPDGTQLTTGSYDNTAKIWDLNTGKETSTLNGHDYSVRSVAFSPDGSKLATGSDDNTAKIWDLNTGKEALTLNGHSSSVRSVAFSPDGSKLATGSSDYTAKIWNLNTGKESLTLNGHDSDVLSVAFSPDGSKLATGSYDYTAKIWDLNTRKETITLNGHDSYVLSVAFSPDGTQLATGSLDNTAKIWDLNTRKETSTLNGHDNAVWSVAFSPDGTQLATGSLDNTAKIWDLNTRKETSTLNGHDNSVYSVAFSPDGTQLATGSLDNTAKIWDLTLQGWLARAGQGKLLAGLTLPQLSEYGLENLLDQQAHNEDNLMASQEVWQIVAFAELAAESTRNSKVLERTARDYGRAARLYEAATQIAGDSTFIIRQAQLYRQWALDIMDAARPDTAATYIQWACNLGVAKNDCESLHVLFRLKTWSLAQLLTSEKPDELDAYGDYFFEQEKWEQARQLYEKAEGLEHSSSVLLKLFEIAEKTDQEFDFERLIASDDVEELINYADFFYKKEKWEEARQLYEKAEGLEHSSSVLLKLFEIAEKTDQEFDFERLIASDDVEELINYADFFYKKEKWEEARQLYEKAEGLEHRSSVLLKLFEIAENTDQEFDFERLLSTENVEEVINYADFFYEKEKWEKARQLYEKAEQLEHDADVLIKLFQIAKKAGQAFNFERLLALDDVEELIYYGNYFFEKEKWGQARQLFEKAEELEHRYRILLKLFQIAERTAQVFDFERLLATDDVEELINYGDYFYEQEKWQQAQQLFEKAEDLEHRPRALFKLFQISEKIGQAFDFQQLLAADDVEELETYARNFTSAAGRIAIYKDKVPDYQYALRIREKQLLIDTTAAIRTIIANEYNSLGYYQLFAADGEGAAASLDRAAELNPDNAYIPTNLPWAYLLQGKKAEAKAAFEAWMDKPGEAVGFPTYRDAFLGDLEALEAAGVAGIDFEMVRGWLEEE